MSRARPLNDQEIEEILELVQPGTYVKNKNGQYVQDYEADYITRDEVGEDGVTRKVLVKPKYILVRGATDLYRQQQVKLQRSTLLYSIMHACPEVLDDDPTTFIKLKEGIVELYTNAQVSPNTNVGGYATDAVSEPQTQLTLDSHKSTKTSKGATTTTARRMTQILQVVKKQRNRNMTIHFKNKYLSTKSVIEMCRSIQACPGYTICDFDESITGEVSRHAQDIYENYLSNTFMFMTGMFNDGTEAKNTLMKIMSSNDPISVLNVNQLMMRAHDFDIITLTLAINNLAPGLVYAIPYAHEDEYRIYLIPDGDKIKSVKQTKSSKTAVVAGGAVNLYMNCEFRPMMDDLELAGVRGIVECVPLSDRVASYIENVKRGQFILDGEEFNVCLVLNMPKMHEMSIDASRLADVLHVVGIPTALSSRYMTHDLVSNVTVSRRNLHNYILYARMGFIAENDRDLTGTIISHIMQEFALFKNMKDASSLISIYEQHMNSSLPSSARIVDTYHKIGMFNRENYVDAITAQKQALVDINSYYYGHTIGTNLKAMAVHPDVDFYSCTTDVLYEIYDAMDVPGCRNATVREIANVLSGAGYIPPQHIELTVDNLHKTGAPVPVTANGLTRSGATVIESANRSSALEKLIDGALNNTTEHAHGQLNSVLAARPAKIGTGAMALTSDVETLTTRASLFPSGESRQMKRREVEKMIRGFGSSKSFMPEVKRRPLTPLEPTPLTLPTLPGARSVGDSIAANILAAIGTNPTNILVKSQLNVDHKIVMTEDNKYGVITRTDSSIFSSGAEDSKILHLATTARIKYPLLTSRDPVEGKMYDFKTVPSVVLPAQQLFKVDLEPLGDQGQITTITTKSMPVKLKMYSRQQHLQYSIFSYSSMLPTTLNYEKPSQILKTLGSLSHDQVRRVTNGESQPRTNPRPRAPINTVTTMIENSMQKLMRT